VVGGDDADEAVQDALLKAHRALASGTPIYSLGAWLHAIAHNSALTLLRHRRLAAEYCEERAGAVPTPGIAGGSEQDRLEALVAALLSLPIRQRQALVMRELEGRSYDEIATHLSASHGAVRQLLNRARTSIRARLATLIPVDLALRWAAPAVGSAPSGALTLTSSGAFAAKISSAILLSAAPVVAVTPSPPARATPAPQTAAVRERMVPARTTAPRTTSSGRIAITLQPATLSATGAPRRIVVAAVNRAAARDVRPAARSCHTVTRTAPATLDRRHFNRYISMDDFPRSRSGAEAEASRRRAVP
jgi:RNA polymerase sigma factor (sigma-70 family)